MRLAAILCLFLAGCSLVVSVPEECSTDAECKTVRADLVCDTAASLCVQKACTDSAACESVGAGLVCNEAEGVCAEQACTTHADCAGYGNRFACLGGVCSNACTPARFSSSEADAIRLAAVLPLSAENGSENAAVRVRRWSIELALKEINDVRGGIQAGSSAARKIDFAFCDSRFDDGLTERLAKHLVAEKRIAIVTAGTSETQRVLTVARAADVLVMSVSATADKLTVAGGTPVDNRGLFWRTAPRDELQSDVLVAAMMNGDLYPKLGIFHENNDYGNGLAKAVSDRWQGDEVRVAFDPADPSTARLDTLGDPRPERLLVVGRPSNAAALVRALHEAGALSSASLLFSDSATNQALVDQLGADASRILGAQGLIVWTDTQAEAYTTYVTNYELLRRSADGGGDFEDFQKEGTFGPNAYDALYALAYASGTALAVGSTPTGPLLSQGLKKLTGGTTRVPVGANDFSQGLQTLAGGEAIDLVGASGELEFDANGDVKGQYGLCAFKGEPVSFDLQYCEKVD